MTLTDLAALASILSSVAVLVSLVYLSLQVRQAERNQQASIRQGRATRAVDIILAAGEAGAIEAMPRGAAGAPDLTALEFGRFAAIYGAFLASAEDSFFQHREGLLSDAVFASFAASWRVTLAQPGVRALWALRRGGFEAGFAAFLDGLVAQVPVAAPADLFAAWRAQVARETAQP